MNELGNIQINSEKSAFPMWILPYTDFLWSDSERFAL